MESLSHNNEIIELNDQVEVISIDSTIITVKKSNMGITIITSLIALLVVAFALQGIKIVQQSETVIVER